MKYLGIDFGEKRTGIAASDTGGSMAFARTTLRKTTRDAFWNDMLRIIDEERAEALVVGMPRTRDGRDSLIVRRVRNFIASLKRRCPLPLYVMDETLSSFDAETRLRDAGKSASGLDGAAAATILESFLRLPEEKRVRA
jgi:putative Holliday junction resolvase